MNIEPTVSVIVPTYNSAETLLVALRSIQRQDRTDFEVLVIGDGCTDESGSVVAGLRDTRFQWINLSTNSGSQAVPNTEGIRRSRGKYVAILSHDDLWFPWHLRVLAEFLDRNDYAFAHSLCAQLSPKGLDGIKGDPPLGRDYTTHMIPTCCWMFRRDHAIAAGPWRSPITIRWPPDADFLHRIALLGGGARCLQDLSAIHFPAAWWRTYAADGGKPSVSLAPRLEADPEGLRRELLTQGAVIAARYYEAIPRPGTLLRQLMHSAAWHFVEWLGSDRWPLRPLLVARTRRIRRRVRAEKGLPASTLSVRSRAGSNVIPSRHV